MTFHITWPQLLHKWIMLSKILFSIMLFLQIVWYIKYLWVVYQNACTIKWKLFFTSVVPFLCAECFCWGLILIYSHLNIILHDLKFLDIGSLKLNENYENKNCKVIVCSNWVEQLQKCWKKMKIARLYECSDWIDWWVNITTVICSIL